MQALLVAAILVFGAAAIVWILRRSRKAPTSPRYMPVIVDAKQAKIEPYPYIYVNADGSARELHPSERKFLETPFHPADGGRQYIKDSYSKKDGWGGVAGVLKRSKLPRGTQVHPAPGENPTPPFARDGLKQFLRDKGVEVIENSDGTFTARKPTS